MWKHHNIETTHGRKETQGNKTSQKSNTLLDVTCFLIRILEGGTKTIGLLIYLLDWHCWTFRCDGYRGRNSLPLLTKPPPSLYAMSPLPSSSLVPLLPRSSSCGSVPLEFPWGINQLFRCFRGGDGGGGLNIVLVLLLEKAPSCVLIIRRC